MAEVLNRLIGLVGLVVWVAFVGAAMGPTSFAAVLLAAMGGIVHGIGVGIASEKSKPP